MLEIILLSFIFSSTVLGELSDFMAIFQCGILFYMHSADFSWGCRLFPCLFAQ